MKITLLFIFLLLFFEFVYADEIIIINNTQLEIVNLDESKSLIKLISGQIERLINVITRLFIFYNIIILS